MKNNPPISKENLYNLYVDKNLSIHSVGDNIGKSGDTISRWLKYYKISIRNNPKRYDKYRKPLTPIIKEFIIGSLLGDGNLDYHLGKRSETCRIRFCHSVKQLDYIIWKKNFLGNLVQQDLKKYEQLDRSSIEFSFQSIIHEEFVSFYHIFYKNKRKQISYEIQKYLTPFSLAIWYMDDGWKRKNQRTIKICSDSFTYNENCLLVNMLKDCFNIISTVVKSGKHFRIKIGRDNADLFINIVKPYIIPSMMYKTM